jgi:4-oxalmesaconate hydratase
LNLMISHGGGSIPFQVGRWRSNREMQKAKGLSSSGFGFRGAAEDNIAAVAGRTPVRSERFDETLKRFWFDTVVHNPKSLELLFDVVGPDRCVFGTERPGSGSGKDPDTGRAYDDLKPVIEAITTISAADKRGIFEDNARKLFPLFKDSPVVAHA